MTSSWRVSAIADRHRALGSALEDWNGMGTAWSYASDLQDAHVAIRTRAGLLLACRALRHQRTWRGR